MTVMEFKGNVSAQEQAGELVTITITKPDNTTEIVTATTTATRMYSVTKDLIAGTYTAQAKIDEDAKYESAQSILKTFVVALEPRTITLDVAVAQ